MPRHRNQPRSHLPDAHSPKLGRAIPSSDLGADLDPDVTREDLPVLSWSERGLVLAAMATGGLLGGLARYGMQQLWPQPLGSMDWTIAAVNVLGCALLGVLMALVETRRVAHRLVRPFLGVGVCGGFTTFSASLLDTERLLEADRLAAASGQFVSTLLGSIGALGVTLAVTTWLVTRRDSRRAS